MASAPILRGLRHPFVTVLGALDGRAPESLTIGWSLTLDMDTRVRHSPAHHR
jgi:hypothetical protein